MAVIPNPTTAPRMSIRRLALLLTEGCADFLAKPILYKRFRYGRLREELKDKIPERLDVIIARSQLQGRVYWPKCNITLLFTGERSEDTDFTESLKY